MDSNADNSEIVDEPNVADEAADSEVDAWAMLRDVILPHRLQTPVSK